MDTLMTRAAAYLGFEEPFSDYQREKIINLIKALFPSYVPPSSDQQSALNIMLQTFCDAVNKTPDMLFAATRKREIVEDRQIFQYLAMTIGFRGLLHWKCKVEQDDIANLTGVDRTTVLHSEKLWASNIETYPKYKIKIEAIYDMMISRLAEHNMLLSQNIKAA